MTQDYRNRINQIAEGIKHEPEMRKMRDDLSEGIKTTGNRQADVEEQFQEVIENTTDKDVVSAPEIIAARNGEPNLKSRLDKENQEVTAQLAQNTIQVSVEEPDNALIWYEDKGKAPINFENNSGINIQNAELSKTEPTDTQKLWFDKN